MKVRCLVVDDEPLPRERIVSLLRADPRVGAIAECSSGECALEEIDRDPPDIVFLDINMPGIDGLDVARRMDGPRRPVVVFVTGHDEHALAAFEARAEDYVLKPIAPGRFSAALGRAITRFEERSAAAGDAGHSLSRWIDRQAKAAARFVSRRGNAISFVHARDVEWIDAAANYVRMHVAGRAHFVRMTMGEAERQLDEGQFVRVHRSVIVNLDHVMRLESGTHGEYHLTMRDGTRIDTSRACSERLRRLIR